MSSLVRIFIFLGILLLVIAGLIYVLDQFHIPLGHLPGDISIKGKSGSFYFPITTCLLISAVLTVVINLAVRFFKK
jgi:hypothetical protein